jgi:hypothetical protein
MEDWTGRWLAERYRLDRRIGTDATGDWYEAWDGAYFLPVTVHILSPGARGGSETLTPYRQQAGRLRRIRHPGLLSFHDIVQDGEALFLVLDELPGSSLAAMQREHEGRYAPLTLAFILRPVAEALDTLHAAGIVHRNVDLTTIMLPPGGQGILREPAFIPPGLDATLFPPRASLSPEQVDRTAVDARTDVYAFGALLYELLTGAPPFTGAAAPPEIAADQRIGWEQRHRTPPSPRSGHPQWDAAILSALSPDPALRPPRVSGLIGTLLEFEETTSVPRIDETDVPASMTAALPRDETTALPAPHLAAPVPRITPAPIRAAAADDPEPEDGPRLPDGWSGGPPPRRRGAWVPVLAVLTLLVLASAITLGVVVMRRNQTVSVQQDHYTRAEFALSRGDYDTAISEFTAAGSYRDASARVTAAQTEQAEKASYDAGVAAFGREDYTAAVEAFSRAGPFQDAAARRNDAQRLAEQQQAYQEGQAALAQEDYAAAANAFARAGNYKDAPTLATQGQNALSQQRQYQTGQDASAKEDYATAAAAYRAAGAFKDAPARAQQADRLRVQKAAYDAGAAAFAKQDFTTAKDQFVAAGDYKDAQSRATQADQEGMLLGRYTSARNHLQASQWKDAYTDLQAIKQVRPDYKDVPDIITHLENDVINPTTIDLGAALNQGNGYKEGWVPVNNLIGQPVVWLYVVPTLTWQKDNRPDLIGAVSLYLVTKQGNTATGALNTDVPTLGTSGDLKDTAAVPPNGKLFAATDKAQTFDVQDFGKYRARLTVRDVTVQSRAPIHEDLVTATPVFTRLVVDITLSQKPA